MPANGRWRFTQTAPVVPGGYSFDARVVPSGAYTGPVFWTSVNSTTFTLAPGIGWTCLGNGQYIATSPSGNTEGTCEYLGE